MVKISVQSNKVKMSMVQSDATGVQNCEWVRSPLHPLVILNPVMSRLEADDHILVASGLEVNKEDDQ
ncbi:hypothetical protein R1flu_021913 [Riccia fluitans]|uniref:Uncharacterized protein n=1 Tax=Riccia fluitans TaxID=41844 RepID=A0ABD1ZR29_9MARC